jgi:hypothetical protein
MLDIKYDRLKDVYSLVVDVTADATGEKTIPIPFACEVIDAIVMCTASSAGGTLTVKKGSTAITDAMICAVDKVIVRAGTIDDAQSTLAEGDAVSVDANQAANDEFQTKKNELRHLRDNTA